MTATTDAGPHFVTGDTFKHKDAIKKLGGKYQDGVWTIPGDKVDQLPTGLKTKSVAAWEAEYLPNKSAVGAAVSRQNGTVQHAGVVADAANVAAGGKTGRMELIRLTAPTSDGYTHMVSVWGGDPSGKVRFQLFKDADAASQFYAKSVEQAGGAK